jgi:ATP phosphoribosyltransferase
MAVDLGRNRYRIGPVVEDAFPAATTPEAVAIWQRLGRPVRIASEFPATAEQFARDNHLAHTAIIPIAGASEGFVPEDADFLIEGTETGTSLRANGLKMLDAFMDSTNCVIWRKPPVTRRVDLLRDLVQRLRASVGAGVH